MDSRARTGSGLRQSKPLFSAIRSQVVQIAAVTALTLLFSSYTLVAEILGRIDQLVSRDSAAFAANLYLAERSDGAAAPAALDNVMSELSPHLPEGSLLLADRTGTILGKAGACDLRALGIDPAVLTPFAGPYVVYPPFTYHPVCAAEEKLLSGAAIEDDGRTSYLLLTTGTDRFLDQLHSLRGMAAALAYPLAGTLLLLLCSSWSLIYFRRLFLRHAGLLSERARQFAGGNLAVRFDPGEFPEHESIARTFNSLADDLTSRIDALQRDDEERQRIMTGLAHDMRTPLTAIEGCVDLLRTPGIPASRRSSYLELIGSSIASERELARSLDQLASISDPAQIITRAPLLLDALVSQIALIVRPIAERRNILLVLPEPNPHCSIDADGNLLRRALLNLLDNALRHTPDGGRVEMSITAASAETTFEIRNDGPAFSERDRERVASRIGPGEKDAVSPPGEIRRNGLGLTIVRRIVELHDGILSAESAQATGTIFRIRLPAGEPAAKPAPDRSLAETPLSRAARAARRTRFTEGLFIVATVVVALTLLLDAPSQSTAVAASCLLLFQAAASTIDRRVLFHSASLLVILRLLWLDFNTSHHLLFGWATVCGVLHLFRAYERASIRILLILLPFVVLLPHMTPFRWLFLLGVTGGIWISSVGWLAEAAPPLRRAGFWLSSLLTIVTTAAVFFTACALYFIILQRIGEVGRAEAARILPALIPSSSSEAVVPAERTLTLEERLVHAYLLNPILDYIMIAEDGSFRSIIGSDPMFHSVVLLQQRLLEWGTPALLPSFIELSTTRKAALRMGCGEPGCRAVAALSPSKLLNDIAHRLMAVPFTWFIVGQILLAVILYTGAGRRWTRAIRSRTDALNKGLQRYREGRYGIPIGLSPDDEIGELACTFDGVAQQIASLEQIIFDRGRNRRKLFERAAVAIDTAALRVSNSCSPCSSGGAHVDLPRTVAALRRTVESVFDLAALEAPQLVLPTERYSLSELVEEEVCRAEAAASDLKLRIVYTSPPDGLNIVAPVAPLLEAIRTLLDLAIERSSEGGEVVIRLRRMPLGCELTIADSGPKLAPGELRHALEPLEDSAALREFREAADNASAGVIAPSGLPGFALAVAARKIRLCGGTLAVENASPPAQGMMIRVVLPGGSEAAVTTARDDTRRASELPESS